MQDAIRELHNSFKMRKPAIPPDLSYLEGAYRKDYLYDMRLCQHWAKMNRSLIVNLITDYFIQQGHMEAKTNDLAFESVHNYIGDDNIIRKGGDSRLQGAKVHHPAEHARRVAYLHRQGQCRVEQFSPHTVAGRIMRRT